MKVKFYSEVLDKYFDTKDDCFKAEAKVKAKKEQECKLYQAYMKAKEDYEKACKNFHDARRQYFNYKYNVNNTDEKEVNYSEMSLEDIFKYLLEKQ